ncbi:MAG: hypothetical protein AAFY73_15325, partial [Pseudomonadota bacterium]
MAEALDEGKSVYAWLERARSETLLKGGRRRYDLLDYLVREELEGRGESLKAYAIALDVLGRGDDFDPATDSIVRVEVARLRDALELYYARSTAKDEPKITIPKGGYKPVIEIAAPQRERAKPTDLIVSSKKKTRQKGLWSAQNASIGLLIVVAVATGTALWWRDQLSVITSTPETSLMPQIAVEVGSTRPDEQEIAQLFVQHVKNVILRLGQLYELRDSQASLAQEPDQVRLLVEVTTSPMSYSNEVLIEVFDDASGELVFSSALPVREPEQLIDFLHFEDDLAPAFTLAGPVFAHISATVEQDSDLGCVMGVYSDPPPVSQAELLGCLSEVWSRHESSGIVGVQYARLVLAEARDESGTYEETALRLAQETVETVLDDAPNLPGALLLFAEIAFIRGDYETSFRFFERVLEINPTGSHIRANFGRRLLQVGENEKAVDELTLAFELSEDINIRHQAYLYLSLLDFEDRIFARETAYRLSSETRGLAGLVAVLANDEIGDLYRARQSLSTFGQDAVDARRTTTFLLQRDGFTQPAIEIILSQLEASEAWLTLFEEEE